MKKCDGNKQETLYHYESISPKLDDPELVSFRDLVPDIINTGYLTHSTHYYPAKFIPQVVKYCIQKYSNEKDLIIDPFAGSGTVGLEAYISNRDSFLLDINPILNHIIPIKIYTGKQMLDKKILYAMLEDIEKSNSYFRPSWSNINYWYPDDFLEVLCRYWGYQKQLENGIYSHIIETSLIKVSKHFSYAEHKIPKLFKSKRKRKYIEEILQNNWRKKIIKMIYGISLETLDNINQFIKLTKNLNPHVEYYGGVDSSSYEFEPTLKFNGLITSPPYLQAQEYIRTSKLDLYWLGYNEKQIKNISRLEIPYRKPSRIISTKTLDDIKNDLKRKDLKRTSDSYFSHTIDTLERSMNKMKDGSNACIFIGNPTVDGIPVEIWRILKEYFVEKGYYFEGVYEDEIKTRQLFGSRNNKNPKGMKSEYMLILKK